MLIYTFTSPYSDRRAISTSADIFGRVRRLFVSGHVSIAFNDDFNWAAESLFAHCALHEIGHSIGRPFAHRSLSYVAYTHLLITTPFIRCTPTM